MSWLDALYAERDALAGDVERLIVENQKLRAALKPFALTEHQIERWYGMDVSDSHNVVSKWVTVGDLRAAAAALKETGDD